jgi:photosystem II stability/assembly factor-like uncharacterized protein
LHLFRIIDHKRYIHTSTDSGATWSKRGPWGYWTSVASSTDENKLAALTSAGLVYTSTDSGVTWTKLSGGGHAGVPDAPVAPNRIRNNARQRKRYVNYTELPSKLSPLPSRQVPAVEMAV